MNEVSIYSKAEHILAEYRTVDEVKDYRDKALAVEVYAKQANNTQLEYDAACGRVRAERRCGVLLRDMDMAKGTDIAGRTNLDGSRDLPSNRPKTLSEMGVTKDQSSKWQKLAAVPEDEFEKAVSVQGSKPSTNHIIKKKATENRMDSDALWLWGTLRDMREMKLFDKNMDDIVSEWTPAMKEDAESIIPKLKEWINYE